MRISIFGLGYVGSVSAGCFAALGHYVIGVDPVASKVSAINSGSAPVIEKDLDRLILEGVSSGRLRATADATEAIGSSDISLICVGTPSESDGGLDLSFVRAVAAQIGSALRNKDGYHLIVVRSTVLPGTLNAEIIPALERASGKIAGRDFGVGHNPEFMREGSAVADFYHPPKTVIGAMNPETAQAIAALYAAIEAPLVITSIETSEMVKYADNIWHALKISFTNEMATLAKAMGVDGREVMDIFCKDTVLNISGAYLRPGFAFGGSCLPKDLLAVTHAAATLGVELPVTGAILKSNRTQLQRGVEMVLKFRDRPVSLLGLSFKAATDDLRSSQNLALARALHAAGVDLKIFDSCIVVERLMGANRKFLLESVPGLKNLMLRSLDEALAHGDVIVVANGDKAFLEIGDRLRPDQILVDLVGIDDAAALGARYHGISW